MRQRIFPENGAGKDLGRLQQGTKKDASPLSCDESSKLSSKFPASVTA
jgi:hypothetical protein